MSVKSTARHAPRAADGKHGATTNESGMNELAAYCMGLPWLKLWSDAYLLWADQLQALATPHGAGSAEDRRSAAAPWVPRFDATVIPFRRRDDDPGMEATRWSMRVHVPAPPWLGASSNVIAFDTLVPRPSRSGSKD